MSVPHFGDAPYSRVLLSFLRASPGPSLCEDEEEGVPQEEPKSFVGKEVGAAMSPVNAAPEPLSMPPLDTSKGQAVPQLLPSQWPLARLEDSRCSLTGGGKKNPQNLTITTTSPTFSSDSAWLTSAPCPGWELQGPTGSSKLLEHPGFL